MSLKLITITPETGIGEFDGAPFRAELSGGRFVAQIGEGRDAWRHEWLNTEPDRGSTGAIRGLIYRAIALYRNDQRGLPCPI